MAKDPDKLLLDLTGALTKALGDNLVTLALYGSTARGYHVVAEAGCAASAVEAVHPCRRLSQFDPRRARRQVAMRGRKARVSAGLSFDRGERMRLALRRASRRVVTGRVTSP